MIDTDTSVKKMLNRLKTDGESYLQHYLAKSDLPVVHDRDVLFLYRDPGNSVKEVRLVHHIYALDRAPKFQEIGNDHIYALHLVLPVGARMEYTFGLTYKNGGTQILTDPNNPHKAWCPFGPKSVVTTDQYRTPDWGRLRNGTPRGKVTDHKITSSVFGDKRFFRVYLPAGAKRSRRYPLLVIHDGSDYMNYAYILDVLDNLIHDGTIPELVAVLTDPVNRNDEYSCMDDHSGFIARELIPWVRRRYPVTRSRSRITLMGASLGAVASLYCSHQYPDIAGNLLLQSGSFRFQDLVKTTPIFEPIDEFDRITLFLEREYFPRGPAKKTRFFISCGTFEALIRYNHLFASKIRKLGHPVLFAENHDGHNWISWRDNLKSAFAYLLDHKKE